MNGKERPCVFVGGPYDGWEGDFLDIGQQSTDMGESGMRNDIYDRDERQTRDNKVRFVWNRRLSAEMWKQWAVDHNLPPDAFEQKKKLAKPSLTGELQDGEEERPAVRLEIKHNERSHEWELVLMGKVEAAVSDKEIGVPNPAKPDEHAEKLQEWVKSLGIAQ